MVNTTMVIWALSGVICNKHTSTWAFDSWKKLDGLEIYFLTRIWLHMETVWWWFLCFGSVFSVCVSGSVFSVCSGSVFSSSFFFILQILYYFYCSLSLFFFFFFYLVLYLWEEGFKDWLGVCILSSGIIMGWSEIFRY